MPCIQHITMLCTPEHLRSSTSQLITITTVQCSHHLRQLNPHATCPYPQTIPIHTHNTCTPYSLGETDADSPPHRAACCCQQAVTGRIANPLMKVPAVSAFCNVTVAARYYCDMAADKCCNDTYVLMHMRCLKRCQGVQPHHL